MFCTGGKLLAAAGVVEKVKLDAELAPVLKEKLLEAAGSASEVLNTGAAPVDPAPDILHSGQACCFEWIHETCATSTINAQSLEGNVGPPTNKVIFTKQAWQKPYWLTTSLKEQGTYRRSQADAKQAHCPPTHCRQDGDCRKRTSRRLAWVILPEVLASPLDVIITRSA